MTFFSTIFQKNRRLISLIMAFVVFILLLISPNNIRPIVGDLSNYIFYSLFSEIKNYRYNLYLLGDQNRKLQNLVTEYSLQLNAMTEAKRENERLREFLGFEPPDSFAFIPVKIVSLVDQIEPIAAVVNKGSYDSIVINMPVINRYGLVGKIKEVMPNHSVVSLLTDPANAVSGRIAISRQIGIVRYSSQKGMYLDNLPADAVINSGDVVLTSGLGGVYPTGINVAIIDSTHAEKEDILKTVWLRPNVNFRELDELYVLKATKR